MVIAAIFLIHGLPKLLNIAGTMSFFSSLGFPAFMGPVVGIAEVLAAIALIVGIWHRRATYVLGLILVVAILAVQLPGAFRAGAFTPSLERDILLLSGVITIMAHGAGKFAMHQ